MSNAATAQATGGDDHLDYVRACVELFTILFCEIYEGGPKRYIARAIHVKASAFLRGLEALLRRVLLIRAAALVPGLPPAKPPRARAARARRTAPAYDPADPKTWRASFCALKRHRQTRNERKAPVRRGPAPALADLRPMARRMHAIEQTIENIDASARRLARRLRQAVAHGERIAIIDRPRLHPEHVLFLETKLDVFREDANDALRALAPDTS